MDQSDELHWPTVLGTLFAITLSLFIGLVSLSRLAQTGPDVGEIVVFEPRSAPREWALSTIPANRVSAANGSFARRERGCVLNPSIMARSGGSLVIEAKETTAPPIFRVHWSGERTALGAHDCGKSADLTLSLVSLHMLATAAGGFGVGSRHGLY